MRRLLIALLPLPLLALALFAGGGVGDVDPTNRFSTEGKPVAVVGEPLGSPFALDPTKLSDCSAGPAGARCREQAFGNLAFNDGPEAAWATLRGGIAGGSIPADECHMLTHRIGAGTLLRFDDSIDRVVEYSAPDCSEGYLHGAFEPLFTDLDPRDGAALAGRVAELCGSGRAWTLAFVQINCMHGAAHATMLRSGYNLPLALDVCRRATITAGEPEDLYISCLEGAFMENFIPSYAVRSPWLSDEDLRYPCPTFTETAVARACWVQLGDRLALLADLTLEGFAQVCAEAPAEWRVVCFQGFGRTVAFRSLGAPSALPVANCTIARPFGGEAACYWQFANSTVVELRGSGQTPISAPIAAVCRLAPDDRTRQACWQGIGYGLYTDGGAEGAYRDENGVIRPTFDPAERCRREGIDPGAPLDWCAAGATGRGPEFLGL